METKKGSPAHPPLQGRTLRQGWRISLSEIGHPWPFSGTGNTDSPGANRLARGAPGGRRPGMVCDKSVVFVLARCSIAQAIEQRRTSCTGVTIAIAPGFPEPDARSEV